MRKQELVHLHCLLAEVAKHCERENGAVLDLDRYRSLNTGPMSVDRSKTDHEAAVFALADALTTPSDGKGDGRVPVGTG